MQSDYHTTTWNTENLFMAAPKEQVSASELSGLLKGRKFGQNSIGTEDVRPIDFSGYSEYELADIEELESYCKSRGIIGVNLGNMAPKTMLNMLRNKAEGKFQPASKKGLIYG